MNMQSSNPSAKRAPIGPTTAYLSRKKMRKSTDTSKEIKRTNLRKLLKYSKFAKAKMNHRLCKMGSSTPSKRGYPKKNCLSHLFGWAVSQTLSKGKSIWINY
jgi:cell division protein FtsI/penicillin-binding protein 2